MQKQAGTLQGVTDVEQNTGEGQRKAALRGNGFRTLAQSLIILRLNLIVEKTGSRHREDWMGGAWTRGQTALEAKHSDASYLTCSNKSPKHKHSALF